MLTHSVRQGLKRLSWLEAAIFFLIVLPAITFAQKDISSTTDNFPGEYGLLTSDSARMHFLMTAIGDSLDEGQLSRVYDWSVVGLDLAEKNGVDSMKGIFNFFIGKAFTYRFQKPDSAITYYRRVLPYFPNRQRKYNVFSIREIMSAYTENGNRDSAMAYVDTLRALIDTMPVSDRKRVSLSQEIATVFQWFGMNRSALRYYQIAINGERKNGNLAGLGMALANFGEFYNETGNDLAAIRTAKEALPFLEKINMPFSKTTSNIAAYYTNLGLFDSARAYLKTSQTVAEKTNDAGQQDVIRNTRADIYLGERKYDSAAALLQQNAGIFAKNKNAIDLCRTLLSLANLDTALQNYRSAKAHLQKALQIAKQLQQQSQIIRALQNLAFVNAKLGDYKAAFESNEEFIHQQDSVVSQTTQANLADLQVSYQTAQKEEQIKLLQQANDIKDLQLQNDRRKSLLYLLGIAFIAVVTIIVIYQRGVRHRIEIKKWKAELETKILRLQMNPHFIFNSLNSIENFIMGNEKRLASDYLNKFARLIRMILESSNTEVVPIPKDMEALQLYIDLEQLRFNHKFSYKTYVDPALLGGDYRAPSLLIQPYVENAIIHGLANSDDRDLSLTVAAFLEEEKIKYVIQDNGIGRQKSGEYNRANKPYHQSVGLKITEERIRLFNNQRVSTVRITDLYDENDSADGTKVEIIINAS